MPFFPNMPVMYVNSENGFAGSKEAFEALEKHLLHKLTGRKFYGVYQPATNEYRACVSRISTDDPIWFGLKTWVIPAGRYFREKIKTMPESISERKELVEALISGYGDKINKKKPVIEYFEAENSLTLYLPK
jgi:hypothetical protein